MRAIISLLLGVFILLVLWFFIFPIPKVEKVHKKTPQIPLISTYQTPNVTEKNIKVTKPKNLDKIYSALTIEGEARVFENIVSIRLSSVDGKVIFQTTTYANSPDVGKFGTFKKQMNFQTSQKEGILEVFQISPKDGSEVDKVSIPILFSQ